MKNQFNRASVIEEYKKQGNFLEVHWHNPEMEENEIARIPIKTFENWLDETGRLMAPFCYSDENGINEVYVKSTIPQYWADNLGIECDLKSYLLILKGEVAPAFTPLVADLHSIFRMIGIHNLPKSA